MNTGNNLTINDFFQIFTIEWSCDTPPDGKIKLTSKVLKLIETQNKIDAWMADKIAVVANDLKDVCDAMQFGNDVE